MATKFPLPTPTRSRTTEGSKRLAEYADRNGLRPVAWYVPRPLHTALVALAARVGSPLQALVTNACERHYGNPRVVDLPPLVPPTQSKSGDHVSFTWYAPEELHINVKVLAAQIRSSAQQLITSAVVHACREAEEVKSLHLLTGVAPQARNTETTPELIAPPPARRR